MLAYHALFDPRKGLAVVIPHDACEARHSLGSLQ